MGHDLNLGRNLYFRQLLAPTFEAGQTEFRLRPKFCAELAVFD